MFTMGVPFLWRPRSLIRIYGSHCHLQLWYMYLCQTLNDGTWYIIRNTTFLFASWMPIHWIGRGGDQTMNENWNLKKRPKSIRIQALLHVFVLMSFCVGLTSPLTCARWLTFLTLKAETLPVPWFVRFLRTRSDSNRESEDVQEVNLIHCMQILSFVLWDCLNQFCFYLIPLLR